MRILNPVPLMPRRFGMHHAEAYVLLFKAWVERDWAARDANLMEEEADERNVAVGLQTMECQVDTPPL
jgi:hypothetical protein